MALSRNAKCSAVVKDEFKFKWQLKRYMKTRDMFHVCVLPNIKQSLKRTFFISDSLHAEGPKKTAIFFDQADQDLGIQSHMSVVKSNKMTEYIPSAKQLQLTIVALLPIDFDSNEKRQMGYQVKGVKPHETKSL